MKKYVKSSIEQSNVIFQDGDFTFVRTSGIGRNNIPWFGLAVKSSGLAEKHVVDVRLRSKGFPRFEDENEVVYEYSGCEVAHGMRSTTDTLEETEEYIQVLQDALDFAYRVEDWLADHDYSAL